MSEKQQDPIPQHAPFVAALRYGGAGLIAVAVVSSVISYLAAGSKGLWGALIGAAVGGAFIIATVLVMYLMRNAPPTTTGGVLMGSWLLKLLVAIGVMAVLRGMDFYNDKALVLTIVATMIVMLTVETMAIVRTRVPYVEAEASKDTHS